MAFETDLIRRYSGAFTREDCQKIIEGIKFFEKHHLLVYDKQKLNRVDNKTVNITHDYTFSASSRLAEEIFPKFKPCVDEYVEAFGVLSQRKFLLHDIKLKEIPAGGGFHAWHYENASFETATRRFVVQAYLNTIENGGETEFLYQNKRINAVEGTVVIWPAGFTHVHRGNPPIGQDKYILTTWGMLQSNT